MWEVRVYVGRDPVTNTPRQVSRIVRAGPRAKTGNPPKAVTDVERQLETQAANGNLSGSSATVAILLEHYLEHLTRKGHSPTTLATYRLYITSTIAPAIGHRPVRKLTAWDLDSLYGAMIDAGKSASTVRQHHAIVSGALTQAVKWGWCPLNVARMASPPTVHQVGIVAPTADEVRAIVAMAEDRNPDLAGRIMLAALTGARRGELCALRWSNVDLAGGTIRIAGSVLEIAGQIVQIVEKSTKTHAQRTLALGEAGVALLQLYQACVLEQARIGEVELVPDAHVFSERLDGATSYPPDKVSGLFTRVRDELGYKHVHLHSLRHFMATTLAARGDVSARTLAGRLGHADASVTLKVYSHFFPPADVEAADHVGRALSS